jgi:hypothetical protein
MNAIRLEVDELQESQDRRCDRWILLSEEVRDLAEAATGIEHALPRALEWAGRYRPDLVQAYWAATESLVRHRREIALSQSLLAPLYALDAEYERVNDVVLSMLPK